MRSPAPVPSQTPPHYSCKNYVDTMVALSKALCCCCSPSLPLPPSLADTNHKPMRRQQRSQRPDPTATLFSFMQLAEYSILVLIACGAYGVSIRGWDTDTAAAWPPCPPEEDALRRAFEERYPQRCVHERTSTSSRRSIDALCYLHTMAGTWLCSGQGPSNGGRLWREWPCRPRKL